MDRVLAHQQWATNTTDSSVEQGLGVTSLVSDRVWGSFGNGWFEGEVQVIVIFKRQGETSACLGEHRTGGVVTSRARRTRPALAWGRGR